MIYLDNAATTSMSHEVINAMNKVFEHTFGNPSSIHTHGRKARKILKDSRCQIAKLLQTQEQNIIFTSGGTESNNTAIKGYTLANRDKGNHIITTSIEHSSVLETVEYLVDKFGFEATHIYPKNGKITAQDVQDVLRKDTILVSIMYANNETGDRLPIKQIGKILIDHPAMLHVDAVQVIGKTPIFPEEIGVDFLSAAAHKFHGPKGVGFLYSNQNFDNLLHGGQQESKKRGGTENLAAIHGMTVAMTESINNYKTNWTIVENLKKEFFTHLGELDFYLNQHQDPIPHIINIGFPNYRNSTLILRLDLAGVSVSTGAACTAGIVDPSHVLASFYGYDSPRLQESIRVSFSEHNTLSEIRETVSLLKKILLEEKNWIHK